MKHPRNHAERSRIGVLLLLLVAVSIVFGTQTAQAQSTACPSNSVQVRPGDSIQAVVDRNAAGTVYCLQDGTYTSQSIIPKDGDSFIAANAGRAILDGGGNTEFAFTGTRNPQSSSNSENVTLIGLVIQNYRTTRPFNHGAVDGNAGWRMSNNIIRNNDAGVIFGKMNWSCSQGAVFENNRFENNRFVAMYWMGTKGTFNGNTFLSNGWSANQQDSDWYGSIKITNQGAWNSSFTQSVACPSGGDNRVMVTQNTSAYNRAAGWWNDINVHNIEISNNYIVGNEWFGIFHEISNTASIINNTVECNRSVRNWDGYWGGADIAVISSSNTTIQGNNVTICGAGATFTAGGQSRTVADNGRGIIMLAEGRAPLNNNRAIGNILQTRGAIEYYVGITSYNNSAHSNNVFDQNTYVGTQNSSALWNWYDSMRTFSSWQSQGMDRASTVTATAPNVPTLPPSATAVTATPTRAAATATATTLPPTATALPATATVLPATATRIPPTATVVAQVPTNTVAPAAGPFFGAPLPVPGRIQVEDFDRGPAGTAYNDTSPAQEGGVHYRTDQHAVDLKPNAYGSFSMGWFTTGEWTAYTINVAQTGTYDITINAGSADANRAFRIEIGGRNVTGSIPAPQTPNWDTLGTVTVRNVSLTAGQQVMRIVNESGFLDIDYLDFARSAAATATTVPATATVVPPTTTPQVPPTATPAPTQPGLRAVASKASYAPGETATVNFQLELPNQVPGGGVRALEATCGITPVGLVSGQAVTAAPLFAPSPVVVSSGFRADGTFTFAISQTNRNPAVSTAGVVFNITAGALMAGDAQVNCTVTAIDGNRQQFNLPFIGTTIRVGTPTQVPQATQAAPTATTVPPTATPIPPTATLIPPTATLVPPTATLPPTPTPTQAPQTGSVSGNVQRSHAQDSGITITLSANGTVVATTTTGNDGSFLLANVAAGTYTIRAEAIGYLPGEGTVTVVGGQTATKTPLVLLAGEIVTSQQPVIDELDVVQMAVGYGQSVSTPSPSDLDKNGQVGLGDLSALADNLRASGPISWP